MKKKKRILIGTFFVLLIIGLVLIYNTVLPKESVARNKSSRMAECNWKPTIANSVNKSVIIANVDAKQLKSNINGIYMEESMALMFPLETVKETFDCAVNKYKDWILELYGDPIVDDSLLDKIKQNPQIRLMGFVDDPKAKLLNASNRRI